ncbi:MAG: HxlR family transcriptional regulator [Gemmatimonadota bacterium]|nr:MAG: HxlR family transcriptional regulator [Gemmatimonadota bacterium]
MTRGYGQYCPLALAAELLTQRWTILIVSRLIDGCTTFNAIHRGVPRISPSLLSQRLTELAGAGIVEKRPAQGGSGPSYQLTPAGEDLAPVIEQMAIWGQFWAREMTKEDLDPAFLAWSMHTRMNVDAMPSGRTTLEFEFTGAPREFRRFWLISESGKIDMCLKHPGFEANLVVRSELRLFIETWRGFRDLRSELRSGNIRLDGPAPLRKQFPDWLLLSSLAPYRRKRPGRERSLPTRPRG